ncbi:MAG TPA: TetR/AcrR family transcriptional regulator [Rhodocyclaceae bacterium]|nr:TetR/AcrR family transcriptional regulator [Rhodocyclaceae bacterium]
MAASSKATNAAPGARQALLEHGLKIVAEKGVRGLVVREAARMAQVNLGSFVYHFGNRERFVEELVELWYAPLFERLKLAAAGETGRSALQRLQATLFDLFDLIAENSSVVSHLFADALAGEQTVRAFLLTMPQRHPKLLLELVAQAQAEGDLIDAPPLQLTMFMMAAAGLPLGLAGGLLRHLDWLPREAESLLNLMADPQAARRRLEWALKGIGKSKGAS